MEYTETERQTLDILRRTDFTAIKKGELVSIASQLNSLRPEVAKAAIEQLPELAELLKVSLSEYRDILDKVIESDQASIQHVYGSANKAIDDATIGREQFLEFAEKVRADYSKCLDRDGIAPEEQADILKGEMEILRMADSKEKEVREQQEKVVKNIDHKDTEKRQFNWAIIGTASAILITVVGVGLAALGGKVDLKLPTKK